MRVFAALFSNSVLCIWRDRRFIAANTVFSLMLVVAASFFFRRIGYGEQDLLSLTPGVVWLIFIFVGVVGLNQLFMDELEDNAMQGLVLQIPDLGVVFLAKCGANILFLCLIQFMVIIAYGIFFSVDIFRAVPALFVLVAALVPGFAAVGTLLSAISVCTSSREVVLPLLLYPLLLTPVAAAAMATNDVLELGYLSISSIPFLVVCVFSVVSFVVSWLLFEFVVRG